MNPDRREHVQTRATAIDKACSPKVHLAAVANAQGSDLWSRDGALSRNARYDDQEYVGSQCPRDHARLDAHRPGTEQDRTDIYTTHVMRTCQTNVNAEGCRSRPKSKVDTACNCRRGPPFFCLLLCVRLLPPSSIFGAKRYGVGPSAGSSPKAVHFSPGPHPFL